MALTKIASKNDLPAGKSKVIRVNGLTLALFNIDGKFYAMGNTCLHRGGPIGEGILTGTMVMCPWHGWEYDVTTGQCMMNGQKLNTYKVEIKGEDVFVDL